MLEERIIGIWSTQTGEQLATLKGHTEPILAAAFSPDGNRLLSVDESGTLKVWEVRSVEWPERAENKLGAVRLSADGLLEVVYHPGRDYPTPRPPMTSPFDAWNRREVSIRDSTGKELVLFKEHTAAPFNLQFSPDGRYVVSGDWYEALVWEARTGKVYLSEPRATKKFPFWRGPGPLPQFSGDSQRLAVNDEDDWVRVLSVRDWKPVSSFKVQTTAWSLSPDGRRMVSLQGAPDPGHTLLKLWDVDKATELFVCETKKVRLDADYPFPVFSPDSKRCAFRGLTGIIVVDAISGVELTKLPLAAPTGIDLDTVLSAMTSTFSNDGSQLAVAGRDKAGWEIVVYDMPAGKERCRLRGHSYVSAGIGLAFSPDGKRIASLVTDPGSSKMELKLWDPATGSQLLSDTKPPITLRATGFRALKIAFSPDGHRLHLVDWDGSRLVSMPIWDATPPAKQ
jgi:WD40 repeat protein